jgi:phage-related protein
MSTVDESPKEFVLLHGQIKTPPFSVEARNEAGTLIRRLQGGESIGMPHSRPMPSIGPRCHELRIKDEDTDWRIFYRIDRTEIVVAEVVQKGTKQTPKHVIDVCQQRYAAYDEAIRRAAKKATKKAARKRS